MKNIIITLSLTLFMGVGLMSCAAMEGIFGEGTVFTTSDQLVEGQEGTVVPFDMLPESVKSKVPEGTSVVMANKDQLKDGAAFIPTGGELDGDSIGGMVDAGFGIASAFIPGLAAWEGVVTLFSKRKRKHYGNMVKAIIPTDKNMDFGGALKALGSGLGIAHSSEATKAVHDEEQATVTATKTETKA
tara:strand:- start:79 stop:639 length:561 start_codon:yes stop_codon:yes gene_type:complete